MGPARAGVHFPDRERQFFDWFATEHHARSYLKDLRWPEGISCPRCGLFLISPGPEPWWCSVCRRLFGVTTLTLLGRTKVPLATWLLVAWRMTQTKNGLSALSVQRMTGLSWQASWVMLHKLRVAMDQGGKGKERLRGDVELDETYVGGEEEGAFGRSRGKKQPVAVACEHLGPRIGRIRLARLPDVSLLSLADFIEANIEPGSTLLTDAFLSYEPALAELERRGLFYQHKVTNLSGTAAPAHVIHPHVHRVASLLKRWLLGTHQGAVEGPHLDSYLDEFVFRFNRRNARNRGLLFYRVCEGLVATEPFPVARLLQRRPEQAAADEAHSQLLAQHKAETDRRRSRRRRGVGDTPGPYRTSEEMRRQGRERYRLKQEKAGKTVRPYRRREQPPSPSYDPDEEPF